MSNRAAYMAAGYEAATDGSCRASSSALLAQPNIRARVTELQQIAADASCITIERVATELAKIAFADVRNAVEWGSGIAVKDEDGNETISNGVSLVSSDEIDGRTAAAISEVAQTRDGVKIKFHDKKAALDSLGKYLGMFTEKTETKINHTFEPISDEETARRVAFILARGQQAVKDKQT